jgi:hypothetical protein
VKRVVHQQPVGSVGGPAPASSFILSQEIVYVSASSLSSEQENEKDGNHLVIPCTLSDYDIKIDTHVVVDCGCTGLSCMNEAFVCQHNFPRYQLKNPKTVEVIDGYPISLGNITEYIEVQYTIGDHHETRTAYLTSLRHYPLVLAIPWLKRHNVTINFAKNDMQFSSPGCLPNHAMVTPILIKGLMPDHRNKIWAVSATMFWHIINDANKRYGNVEQFALSLNEITTAL